MESLRGSMVAAFFLLASTFASLLLSFDTHWVNMYSTTYGEVTAGLWVACTDGGGCGEIPSTLENVFCQIGMLGGVTMALLGFCLWGLEGYDPYKTLGGALSSKGTLGFVAFAIYLSNLRLSNPADYSTSWSAGTTVYLVLGLSLLDILAGGFIGSNAKSTTQTTTAANTSG